MKELIDIQNELKAPKSQYNKFGNYAYRNLEDILEALKPILHKHRCYVTIKDEIVLIGDRYYIKATATLTTEKEKSISNSAYAREAETKKGMDDSQITGATSSYARKYALNGLFAIDDTKDADSTDNTQQPKQQAKQQPKQEAKKPLTGLPKVVAYNGLKKVDFYKFANINSAEDANKLFSNKQLLSDTISKYKESLNK
jgi:hypothetical protein